MADDLIASARSMTSVVDNQYVSIGLPKAALTPATLTAMVGLKNGGAIKVPDAISNLMSNMKTNAFTQVQAIPELSSALGNVGITSANDLNPSSLTAVVTTTLADANVAGAAKTVISTLTAANGPLANLMSATSALSTLTSKLLPAGNPAAFGSFLQQAKSHIADSVEIKKAVNFINAQDFSSYGSGVKDMASMADRGMTNIMGSLSGAAASLKSTGTMFEGISPANMGKPSAFVESLINNKLGNATNVKQQLTAAGVDTADIHNPAYADKINNILGSIKNPTAINAAAGQFGITNPFAKLPSYTGDDSSLYTTPTFLGGTSAEQPASAVPIGAVTIGSSSTSTAFGAASAPAVGTGGIQSLKDLSDPSKLAAPTDTAGFTAGLTAVGNKFADLGATNFTPSKAGDALGAVIKPNIPKLNAFASGLADQVKAAAPTIAGAASNLVDGVKGQLSGLMGGLSSTINNMTGKGTGPFGVPSIKDIMGPISGQNPAMKLALLDPTSPDAHAAITSAVSTANNFFATAGIDLNAPPPNNLKSCMSFATSLHKLGADETTSSMLGVMATDDEYGEAIKASCAEGQNNAVLAEVGVAPPVNDASTTYTQDRAKLEKEEDKLIVAYDYNPLVKYKIKNTADTAAVRMKILLLDTEYGNDADLVAQDNELYQSFVRLGNKLQALLASGTTSL